MPTTVILVLILSPLEDLAIAFLKMVVDRNIREAYDKFIAPDFLHHNQYFKGDRQSLLTAMEDAHRENPNTTLELKQAVEDGNTFVTHSLVKHQPRDSGYAVVHIFKFRNDKIVEMWDLGQVINEDSPNKNGPF